MNAGCFLIGCGPGLNRTDVRRLAGLPTITFNRAFVAWADWGFDPTWYAAFDPVVLEDNVAEISALVASSRARRFFLHECARALGIPPAPNVSFVRLNPEPEFRVSETEIGDFGNVAATSLQLLAALGCRRVALVGVDARYQAAPVSGAGEWVTVDTEPDHFSPGYLSGKRRAARPDFQYLLGRWPLAAAGAAEHGMLVRNATPGSALDCFESVEYENAIEWVRDAREATLSRQQS
jgi:hypothetical protein